MKPFIAVAMSGGVDSTVTAYRLKQQGHEVCGIHFITGYEKAPSTGSSVDTVSAIADRLGIPLDIIDIRREFEHAVIDYFTRTYQAGETPNPCMVCNASIKFGTVLSEAQKRGASFLATGHYAKIVRDDHGRIHLRKGCDPIKEQSYFLALLTQQQLSQAIFPLGDLKKSEVKRFARDRGLSPLIRQESQDICFIPEGRYGEFLFHRRAISPKSGPIVDVEGNLLGEHKGLHLFTIGQRRGINCPAAEPYYVIRIDIAENRLVVGRRNNLYASRCRVDAINWITSTPTDPVSVCTRVRYRHHAAPSILYPETPHTATVRFHHPQTAITPGQCAVFYREGEVLGGGWIHADI